MKKRILPITFLIAILISIIMMSKSQIIAKEVINVFLFFIIPSLAPAMILDYLFLYSGGLDILTLGKNKNASVPIIILGILSGTPTLLTYVDEAIKENFLSNEEAQHIVEAFSMPSFPFLLAISLKLQNHVMKWLLISQILIINLVFYILKKPKNQEKTTYRLLNNTPKNILQSTFLATSKSLVMIFGSMLLFSLPLLILQEFFRNDILYGVSGLFEFSYSLTKLSEYSTFLSYIFMSFIASFGSFSLLSQVSTLCRSISLQKVIKKRFYIALINTAITSIVLLFCYFI